MCINYELKVNNSKLKTIKKVHWQKLFALIDLADVLVYYMQFYHNNTSYKCYVTKLQDMSFLFKYFPTFEGNNLNFIDQKILRIENVLQTVISK